MVKVEIKVDRKVNVERDLDCWMVESCFINIDNLVMTRKSSGEKYKTKEAAVAEMKRRAMEWLTDKGRTETEDQIKWIVQRSGRYINQRPS